MYLLSLYFKYKKSRHQHRIDNAKTIAITKIETADELHVTSSLITYARNRKLLKYFKKDLFCHCRPFLIFLSFQKTYAIFGILMSKPSRKNVHLLVIPKLMSNPFGDLNHPWNSLWILFCIILTLLQLLKLLLIFMLYVIYWSCFVDSMESSLFVNCCGFIVASGSLYWFLESVECWTKVGFRTMSIMFWW